ncbi:MAG: XRE family transcriptional regulator [Anaerolineae bacterium]
MAAPADLLPNVLTDQGTIATDRLAKMLHITKAELATATGLSRYAVSKRDRLGSRQTQARLRDTVEIIHRAARWTGSVGHAFAWYRVQPLPSFGDKTAEDLVKEGRAQAVKDYFSRIAEGGFA